MRRKNRIKVVCKKCSKEFEVIPSRLSTANYCSYKCSNNRERTKEELKKISKKSKQKFIDNPTLLETCSKNGKNAMKFINDNKLNFIMPKGYHTDEHKLKMKELMSGRNVYWKDKIKTNHWSKTDNKDEVVEKINKSKNTSTKWNTVERKNKLINWCMENPDKTGPKMYKKGKYLSSKTNIEQYYQSGLELKYMKIFDEDINITHWTKKHGIIITYFYKNELHRYIPDFLVESKNEKTQLIELKGRIYNQEILDAKNEAAIKYCKENNLEYKVYYK